MASFLEWFFAFVTTMFSGIWSGISQFFIGIVKIFDFATYFGYFSANAEGFGFFGWLFAILAFILVYAFWACLAFIIILAVRKFLRFRTTVVKNDDLLDEIASLHRDLDKAILEKERIIEMKYAPSLSFGDGSAFLGNGDESAEAAEVHAEKRFFRLAMVDDKYVSYQDPTFDTALNLAEICEDFRNYACSQSHLFYDLRTIRLLMAGLSTTKLVILQGISGTGKTSLPYCMGKYFENDSTIASVQPSWKDRSELFGFFNEFTKKFNETEVLCRIYESSYTDRVNIIVLDELNIARIEYYFAEMLSVLELPDKDARRIQLVSSVWENDPLHLADGKLTIPENIWYIGTANNDDTTFSISDKVYDRAFVINLDKKGVAFKAPETKSRRIAYSYIESLYDKAVEERPVKDELIQKIEKLDEYVIERFRVAFGNRIMKQLSTFVPVYQACGGDELDAVDYILATKVFRKFEALNLVLIRDEIKGLVNQLEIIFGKGTMKESITFLQRLQKSY